MNLVEACVANPVKVAVGVIRLLEKKAVERFPRPGGLAGIGQRHPAAPVDDLQPGIELRGLVVVGQREFLVLVFAVQFTPLQIERRGRTAPAGPPSCSSGQPTSWRSCLMLWSR